MDCVPKIEDFELLDKLGSGTYATVYRCLRKDSRECFAIKCVDKAKLSATAVDNIITEIRLLKRLKHQHIVDMREFLWDDKRIYIVMELCTSGSLSTYIRQNHVLPETTCRFFLRHLSLALQYMHSNNVSHFDLKPQNLLLTKTPRMTLKVADFGFAQQHLSADEQNTAIKGSPLYMAPEILLKRCYNAKADLWSIGVILYECLFGHAPYQSKHLPELLDKIGKRARIEIPRTAKISADCQDLLTRLLQHDPDKRIEFADYFAHEFLDLKHAPNEENFQKGIEIVTRAVTEDKAGHYERAYHLYCDSLQYFLPYINAEVDAAKRIALRQQIRTYLHRAEEIKGKIMERRAEAADSGHSQTIAESNAQNTQDSGELLQPIVPAEGYRTVQMALMPSPLYQQLYPLTSSSPAIRSAIEIGRKGELYIFERNFALALKSFQGALSQLVPLLSTEPKGHRRNMLHQLTLFWMQEAESLKAILSARTWEATEDQETKSHSYTNCSIQ